MVNVSIDHIALARIVAAAGSWRSLTDSPDVDLAAACEAAAEAGESVSAAQMTAIGTALGLRTKPRTREEDLDDAIGDAIVAINVEL